jgi:thymidylate synthase
VISGQDPEVPDSLPEYLPFDADHVREYAGRLLSAEKVKNVSYTYGNMMRQHFGVDQIERVAAKLAEDDTSRSAVISLWDPVCAGKGSPCLNHIWFRIIDRALHMTATIRSNDMFFGWPENTYGLRTLQESVRTMVCARAGDFQEASRYGLGDLVIISQSAHIYERDWAPALEIVEKHRHPKMHRDEKGEWLFVVRDDGSVTADLSEKDSLPVKRIEGSPRDILRMIAQDRLVSDIGHALWVGFLLGKYAEKGK